MVTPAIDLINEAAALIGAIGGGQTLSGQDAETCLYSLNALLDSWGTEPLACFEVSDYVLPSWSDQTFTMGPGGDVNVSRPVTIEQGSFVRMQAMDYPLSLISGISYSEISDKSGTADIPTCIRYHGSLPLAIGYLWPVPTGRADIHVRLRTQVPEFTTISTSSDLPQGYRRAIAYSLAEEIAAKFGRTIDVSIVARAAMARRNIKRSQYEPPLLKFDPDTHGMQGRSNWNN